MTEIADRYVRIADPTIEDPAIRAAAQELIDRRNATSRKDLPDIETTRNTIFPAAWARRTAGPAELAAYYRERYTKDGLRGFNQNGRGTYFGRIVAFPRREGEARRSAQRHGPQAQDRARETLEQELAV
jgi:hypothetical protein